MTTGTIHQILMPSSADMKREAVYEIMKRLQSGNDSIFSNNSMAWGILDLEHSAAYAEICRALELPLP